MSLAAGTLLRRKIISLVVAEEFIELVAGHNWHYFREKSQRADRLQAHSQRPAALPSSPLVIIALTALMPCSFICVVPEHENTGNDTSAGEQWCWRGAVIVPSPTVVLDAYLQE
jgi:hypothetical protein